jgi:hypothetical protein
MRDVILLGTRLVLGGYLAVNGARRSCWGPSAAWAGQGKAEARTGSAG